MKRRGFTLVEIIIVVAIIALLAAIAIPNLLRARLTANEAAAQAALKTLATAEIMYRTANPSYGSLTQLGYGSFTPTSPPPYIDALLAGGTKNGYVFTTIGAAESFVATAIPSSANVTGVRCFCIIEDGVVRVNSTAGCAAPTRATCIATGGSWGPTSP